MWRFFLFTLTVFIFSCAGNIDTKQTEAPDIIKRIHLVSNPDSIITSISEVASDIIYIPLQPSAGTQIRVIDKIISRGNKIYINIISDIMCFNDQGHFLYKLYGNEKNVYDYAIYDFDIDAADTSLIVLVGNKILYFKNTVSAFNFKSTIELGRLSPVKMDFLPGTTNILLSSVRIKGYEPSLNTLINLSGDTLALNPNYFKRFNPVKNWIQDKTIHYQFNNKLYLRERFNDTVFSIDAVSNTFKPELIFESSISSTNSENINDPKYYRILPFVDNIFEVTRYLYYAYNFSRQQHKVFYDKYKDKKYEIDPEYGVLKDDIGAGPGFDPMFCSEGIVFSWFGAMDLKKYIESEEFTRAQAQNSSKKESLKILANPLKDTDNPVLIVVRLKR